MRRVGFNLMYLVPGRVGGTETYARELIAALVAAHPEVEFFAYCGREAAPSLKRAPSRNLKIRELPVNCANKPLRIVAEFLLLPWYAWRDRVEILHSLGNTMPPFAPGASVVTIHDLIFHHFPGTFPSPARRGLELLVPMAARRSDRVLAISQHTKTDLAETYGIDPARVDVVYEGSGIEPRRPIPDDTLARLRDRFGIGDAPIVLTVASGLVHKNIARLLEAFAQASASSLPHLVVVGHAGLETDALKRRVAELGIEQRVTMTGWVEDVELLAFYRGADFFIYPSLYEGFGIPVLEAMRRGVPVTCSNATSIPEVVGDAALLFDPTDVDAIRTAIERMLSDRELREDLARRGPKRAAEFTWTRAAEGTWAVYERALKRA